MTNKLQTLERWVAPGSPEEVVRRSEIGAVT